MPLVRKTDKDAPQPQTSAAVTLSALMQGNPEERWAAARAAATLAGGTQALAAAIRSESDLRVREAMFTSLIRIGTPEAAQAMLPLLRADDANLRTSTLDALRAIPSAAREHLPGLLADGDVDVRILSCEILRGLPAEDATPLLCQLLVSDPEVNVCAAAIDVLAEVGTAEALPALERCAARFPQTPFLGFAARAARDRILSQSLERHD